MTSRLDPSPPLHRVHAPCVPGQFLMTMFALVSMVCATGCSQSVSDSPWSDQSLLQVQFYAPAGAEVCVQKGGGKLESKQIASYPDEHRLESPPTQFAAFNLKPGNNYAFLYKRAEGFPGARIYGEVELYNPQSEDARRYMGHSFVPVNLISRHGDARGDHYHPVKGASGTGLGAQKGEHLTEGDVVEKVYFVADLQEAWETVRNIDFHIEKLRSAEAVLNAELELLDNRFQSYRRDAIYADPTINSLARSKDRSGANQEFIRIEADRQRLDNKRFLIRQQIDDLSKERSIRKRLLDTMRIVSRRGSLVLATPENQWPYHDTTEQIAGPRSYQGHVTGPTEAYTTGDIVIPPLGELVCVVRIGGRHMHWDTGDADQVAMNP